MKLRQFHTYKIEEFVDSLAQNMEINVKVSASTRRRNPKLRLRWQKQPSPKRGSNVLRFINGWPLKNNNNNNKTPTRQGHNIRGA